jgi:hypothetical protein
MSQVGRRWADSARFTHSTSLIVKVHLWAVLHDRPTCWACNPDHWDPRTRPAVLPDQSTLSRRLRTDAFGRFMDQLSGVMAGVSSGTSFCKRLDGHALPVSAHSTDRDARWGRGKGQQQNGYKLHLIWDQRPMPTQWIVTPLNVDERLAGCRMVRRLTGAGYLVADGFYDGNELAATAWQSNHQLLCRRRRPDTGLGHRRHHPARLRCIALAEPPQGHNDFGPSLLRARDRIERDLGNLHSFGGGLTALPAWVRRPWRVHAYVHGKLLINAARIQLRRAQRA